MDGLFIEIRLGSLMDVRAGALAYALAFDEYQRLNDLFTLAGLALHVVDSVPIFHICVETENCHRQLQEGETVTFPARRLTKSTRASGEGLSTSVHQRTNSKLTARQGLDTPANSQLHSSV